MRSSPWPSIRTRTARFAWVRCGRISPRRRRSAMRWISSNGSPPSRNVSDCGGVMNRARRIERVEQEAGGSPGCATCSQLAFALWHKIGGEIIPGNDLAAVLDHRLDVPGLWPGDLRSMDVTRRKLMGGLAAVATAVGLGLWQLARAASPRRCLRAVRCGKYPGRIVPMADIREQGKWSG